VFERRAEEANVTKAFAVHARTLELLDARGLAEELLTHGTEVLTLAPLGGVTLDLGKLDSRYARLQIVPQTGTEKVLARRVAELGVKVRTGLEVIDVRQDDGGVDLVVRSDGVTRTERAQYVVACDGAHSAVRRAVGIDFVGKQYSTHILLSDVRFTDAGNGLFGANNDEGALIVVPFGDGWSRAIVWDRSRENVPLDVPVTGDEMRDACHRIAGTDYGMGEPRWTSRFLSERRQATSYRKGRVFLAGDAAHVHSPMGGQGMNTGIQDAFNLGWKLAAAVNGRPKFLDSYQGERHPVGSQVLKMTDGFNQLVLGRFRKLRERLLWLALRLPGATDRVAGRLTGLGIAYPHQRGEHPSVGTRMPDLDLPGGRLYERLRDGRFLLLDGTAQITDDRLTVVPHGEPAILVRPDGYVAWASDEPSAVEVRSALSSWLGT
jgi:2-polyprenyl-6-methoxyphenol hydroxylase-like FAD-dependent oxidoreductase